MHWCKHCTGLEVAPNFRNFPLTALCGVHAEVICRPVHDGTPFAPIQSLYFPALLPLSFLFICTLQWCKHCTWLEVAPNFRKFPFTALYEIDAERVVSRPILDGMPFAPTQILHFQALLLLSFLSICTLNWCNHCTGIHVAPNFRKFPLTVLCGIDAERVLFSPVHDGTLFALTQILHFQALHPVTFLFICTLHWCKHCTGVEVAPNFRKFPLTVL